MFRRFFLRFFSSFLAFILVFNLLFYPADRVEASAPALPLVWDIILLIMTSAGFSFSSSDIIYRTKEENLYESSTGEIRQWLDGLEDNLGDRVYSCASSVSQVDGIYKIIIPYDLWQSLLSVSQQVAVSQAGIPISFGGSASLPVVIGNVNYISLDSQPLQSDGTRGNIIRWGDDVKLSYESFKQRCYDYTGIYNPFVCAVYSHYIKFGMDYSFITWVCPAGGVEIDHIDFSPVNSFDPAINGYSVSPRFVDVDGISVDYIIYGIDWLQAVDKWTDNTKIKDNLLKPLDRITSWADFDAIPGSDFGISDPADLYVDTLVLNGEFEIDSSVVPVPGISDIVAGGYYDVVTPGRDLVDGTLEGDVEISFPVDFPIDDVINDVISGDIGITDALDDVGVIPVDTDADSVIDNPAISISDAIAGVQDPSIPSDPGNGVNDYNLSLTDFFPFCIPVDFVAFITAFSAEPEAPSFTFSLPTGYNGSSFTWTEYTISFSIFDSVAVVVRKGELILFILGLMLMTRRTFLRS